MKLSRLLAGAVLSLSLTLTGCSATSALSAAASVVSPSKPELTAQVGAENTKQGIGVTAKQSDDTKVGDVSDNAKVDAAKQGSDSTTIKDVTGGSVNASKQGSQITNGNVQAKTINVSQSDTGALLWSYALGLASVLCLVFWFVPSPLKRKVRYDGTNTTSSE